MMEGGTRRVCRTCTTVFKKSDWFWCKIWWKQEGEEIRAIELTDGLLEAKEEEMSLSWRRRRMVAYYCMDYSIFSLVRILNVFILLCSFSWEGVVVSSDMRKHIILSSIILSSRGKTQCVWWACFPHKGFFPGLVDLLYVCRRLPAWTIPLKHVGNLIERRNHYFNPITLVHDGLEPPMWFDTGWANNHIQKSEQMQQQPNLSYYKPDLRKERT